MDVNAIFLSVTLHSLAVTFLDMQFSTMLFVAAVLIIDTLWRNAHPRLRLIWWGAAALKAVIPPFMDMPELLSRTVAVPPPPGGMTADVLQQAISSLALHGDGSLHAGDWSAATWVMIASAVLGLALLVIACARHMRLRRLLADAPLLHVEGWDARFPVHVCAGIASPLTIGWRRPRIHLTPAIADGDPLLRLAVLHHERAHAERRDNMFILLQTIVLAVNVLNPFVWLAVRRLSRHREEACDLAAVERSGIGRVAYAEALLAMAVPESSIAARMPVMARLLESRRTFTRRLRALLEAPPAGARAAAPMRALVSCAMLVLLAPMSLRYCEENHFYICSAFHDAVVLGDQVDAPPAYNWKLNLHVPVESHTITRKAKGIFNVIARVSTDGRLSGIRFESAAVGSGRVITDPELKDAVQAELRKSRWSPAKKNGAAVPAHVSFVYEQEQYPLSD